MIDAASVNTNNWTQVKDAAAMEQNNPYASTTKNGFMTYQQSSKKNHKDAIYLPNVAGTYVVFVSYIDEDGAIVQVSETFVV